MPLSLSNVTPKIYLLPPDGTIARQDFLGLLKDPGETWGAAYALTDSLLVSAVKRADRMGVPNHWLLDARQAAGAKEHVTLVGFKLTNGDVTLSTAGPTSTKPQTIMHHKVVVSRATDGGEDWCWIGSVNFSDTGWYQANAAVLFRSNEWARNVFIPWFETTRDWAKKHIPQQPDIAARWEEVEDVQVGTLEIPDWLQQGD